MNFVVVLCFGVCVQAQFIASVLHHCQMNDNTRTVHTWLRPQYKLVFILPWRLPHGSVWHPGCLAVELTNKLAQLRDPERGFVFPHKGRSTCRLNIFENESALNQKIIYFHASCEKRVKQNVLNSSWLIFFSFFFHLKLRSTNKKIKDRTHIS